MSADNGGPAFPTDDANYVSSGLYHFTGMTLRDYFAAKAMQSIIGTWPQIDSEDRPSNEDDLLRLTSEDAYRFADAMLKARQA